jgi:tyrocidine synthetase III
MRDVKKVEKENLEDVISLTPMQEGMLYHYLKNQGGNQYVEQLKLELRGKIDTKAFQQTWQWVTDVNPILRTAFRWKKMNKPVQMVLKSHPVESRIYDYSAEESRDAQRHCSGLIAADWNESFDLTQVPFRITLCKMPENRSTMIISNHHILYDGWSTGIILKEFFTAYYDFTRDIKPRKPGKSTFKSYVKMLGDKAPSNRQKERTFWETYLEDYNNPGGFLSWNTKDSSRQFSNDPVHTADFIIVKKLWRQVEELARQHRVTVATILYSAWGILMQNYHQTDDVVFGTPISGRSYSKDIKGIEDIVGLFINTLPLRIRTRPRENAAVFSNGCCAADLIRRTHQSLGTRQEYETSALVDINKYCDLEQGSELFDSLVLIENYPLDRQMAERSGPLKAENYIIREASNYNITLTVYLLEEPNIQLNIKPGLWDPSYIQQVGQHFMRILEQIVLAPGEDISRFELLSQEEKKQQVAEFNKTQYDFPRDSLIHQLFADQVEAVPDHIALMGITHRTGHSRPTNPQGTMQLTYKLLNETAENLAQLLTRKGTGSETIVAVMMERSIEMIVSLLAIWKASGAYLPIDPEYPPERIHYMLEDSRAPLLLTAGCLTGKGKPSDSWHGETIFVEEQIGRDQPEAIPAKEIPPATGDSSLAYTVYTSGSTGKPKGVMVTHRNVARLVKGSNYIEFQRNRSLLLTSALQFDVSTFEIWGALANGMTLGLPTKDEILHPGALKKILLIFDIQTMWLTTSLFNQLCQLDATIFAGLTTLMVGGDALSPAHINKVRDACPKLAVINGYGPTENTSFSTTHRVECQYKKSVPIGRPIANSSAYIMDTGHRLLPLGVPGELVVGGYGVSRGYMNNPELTSARFIPAPAGPDLAGLRQSREGDFLYKTGDLARWLPGGIIEFLGRMDYQVKIRGFRIELGEIENSLTAYEHIDEAIVVCRTADDGERYLCGYFTGNRDLEISLLRDDLAKQLPDYMIPYYLTLLETMPMTANGKIDRKALPQPQISSGNDYIPPRTEKEKQLAIIWSDILALVPGKISVNESFFQLGGNSLNIIALTAKIHKQFKVELALTEVLERLTIALLAAYIEQKERSQTSPVKPVEKADYYMASSAQKRIYIIQQKDPDTTAYHVTGLFRLLGKFEPGKLEKTFRKLIQRHESLRTSFHEVRSEPVQKVYPDVPFKLISLPGIHDLKDVEKAVHHMIRPFNLGRAPLFRVGWLPLKEAGSGHLLIVDMHHIISDGMSISILIREFMEFCSSRELAAPDIQFKDFSHWQALQNEQGKLLSMEAYWMKRFPIGDEIPVLQLPFDFSRPPVKSYEGRTLYFSIDTSLAHAIRKLAAAHGATSFMVLMTAFNLFLSRISGAEDIVVGTPVSGRGRHELEGIVGMFVNTLAIRNFPRGERPFTEFLREVKENMFAALENQNFPLEDLVEITDASFDPARNPLFDVALALDSTDLNALHIPGLEITPFHFNSPVSKFDMTFTAKENAGTLEFWVSYSAALFREQTMQRLVQCFKEVLADVVTNPDTRLKDVRVLPEEQEKLLLYEFNDTTAPYPEGETLHRLFFRQAEQTPDAIAVVGSSSAISPMSGKDGSNPVHISYRQLRETSLRIASRLRQKGIGDDSIVPVLIERSVEMITAVMGILAAGAGYLPLATDYPVQRIKYILNDCDANVLLNNCPEGMQELERISPGVEVIDPGDMAGFPEPVDFPAGIGSTGLLAYVLYTSGTTGKPKGVMVEHGNVVNVVWWFGKTFSLGPGSHVLQMSDYVFDPSVNQIFGTLLRGAVLYLVGKDTLIDIPALGRFIDRHTINLIYSVPFILNPLLTSSPRHKTLHTVLSAGDRLDDSLKNAIIDKGYRLYNLYGPTETAIDALFEECTASEVTLGAPVNNMRCVVMDKYGKPVPIGVSGELYVAGVGVARGYLNAPLLTADKYVPLETELFRDWQTHKNPRMYKTGDRVRVRDDGRFEFMGRLDHQVKVNGFRVELQEIENLLLQDNNIRQCVVKVIKGAGNQYLCAYYVASSPVSTSLLKNHLSDHMPRQMVPSVFMELERFPLTPAGKVDRKALPQPGPVSGQTMNPVSGQTLSPVQEALSRIWSEVLGVQKVTLGPGSNFFQLGGHSLKMTMVGAKIHKKMGLEVPVRDLFKHLTIGELAAYLDAKIAHGEHNETVALPGMPHLAIEPAQKKDYYPLSSSQKRLHILYRLDSSSTAYNMPGAVILEGQLEKDRMEKAFVSLVQRHESLRTAFEMREGNPVQIIQPIVDFNLEYYPADGLAQESIKGFIRAFDLSRAPLFRVGLKDIDASKYFLMIDMHHIISDGASMEIFIKEFAAFYNGMALHPLRIHYKDYSQWQARGKEKERIKHQEAYWLDTLQGELPELNLPVDFERPAVMNLEGKRMAFEIKGAAVKNFKELAMAENTTLYIAVLSVFNIFLARISGQEDIVIGVPSAGRRHVDLQHSIGMYVNTLVLRNRVPQDITFKQLLGNVKDTMLSALENQDYSFEDLVDQLTAKKNIGRKSLFNVMFDLQTFAKPVEEISSLKIKTCPIDTGTSKFDISLIGLDRGDRFSFIFEYSTQLFSDETIRRFIQFFSNALSYVTANHSEAMSRIEILPQQERERLLYEFNNIDADYPTDKTILRLFEEQVDRTPDHIVLAGMGDHGQSALYLSYRQLNDDANRLALELKENALGSHIGPMVGLIMERSPAMIIGFLAILKTGSTYVPLNPQAPPDRNKYILDECNAKIVLTDTNHEKAIKSNPLFAQIQVMEVGHLLSGSRKPVAYTPHSNAGKLTNFAYVIFTSGSTGKPKGVPISHANFSSLMHWGHHTFGIGTKDRIIQNASIYFDFSLWEISFTISTGAGLVIAPRDLLLDPIENIAFIHKHQITILHVTPAQHQYVLGAGEVPQTIKYILIGGEKLSHQLVQRTFQLVAHDCRVFNLYGPTEVSIMSTAFEIPRTVDRYYAHLNSIPIGTGTDNTALLVLDKHMNLCPINITGELYLAGDGLAEGYINDPEKTHHAFIPNPYQYAVSPGGTRTTGIGGSRLYKTGDLVRWLPEGNLEFIGRIDHQVKIRGFRIELGEIQHRLLEIDAITDALVIVSEEDGNDYRKALCAYYVSTVKFKPSQLKKHLAKKLPDYMIPPYFVPLTVIPLAPGGKADLSKLPKPQLQQESLYQSPANKLEAGLVNIWAEVLAIEPGKIGVNDNFLELGGHSLKANAIVLKIYKIFNVNVPLAQIFTSPTISQLARYIENSTATRYDVIQPAEKREYYELTPAQKRLYVLQHMESDALGYNSPILLEITGKPDKQRLEKTFQQLIARHEAFRTSFIMHNDGPVQQVHDDVPLSMLHLTPERGSETRHIQDFIRPFDLSQAPLLRAGLISIAVDRHLLVVDMHHIVTDGASMDIFSREFAALYGGGQFSPLPLQYKDFTLWRSSDTCKSRLEKQEQFWLHQFTGDIPVLHLPTDFPRSAVQRFDGGTLRFKLGKPETTAVKQLAQQWGVSLYMAFLAFYTLFLSRISGQEDVIVGTPMDGRSHEDLQGIIGMFVNTHGIRNILQSDKTFDHFIQVVKKNTLEVFENQDYPFDQLVNKVVVNREAGHNPLFDVVFTFLDKVNASFDMDGLTLKPYDYDRGITKFDLTLVAGECAESIEMNFQYSSRLFKAETIGRFSTYLLEIIHSLLENPHRELRTIDMRPQREKQRLIDACNQSDSAYLKDKSITQLFAEQVKRTPDHIALVGHFHGDNVNEHNLEYHMCHLTYAQLNQTSGQMAHILVEKGIQENDIVGIQVERCIHMLLGIFAILKAGATYLPLNPKQPPQRTGFMMADAGAHMMLTGAEIVGFSATLDANSKEYHHPSIDADSVAYIIYTSGSTGNPKGVPITHANFSPLLHWAFHEYEMDTKQRLLQNASFFFDWSVWEIFISLTSGASLYSIDADLLLNTGLMLELMHRYDITWLNITPTQYRYLLDENQSQETLKVLNFGAEILSGELVGAALDKVSQNCCVFNLYGPTEATIITAFMKITRENFASFANLTSIPIGWPAGNTQLLVLDSYSKPCPIGVQGELYIAGDAVANGYLNNLELTEDKFISISATGLGLQLNRPLRLYKTGDHARWLPDGAVEYLGRTDHQVKIRGYRIEPGEIKNVLEKNKLVKEALVIARDGQRDELYLCAYIVPYAQPKDLSDLTQQLKNDLSAQLPGYMVPSAFLTLDKMPLNSNGKVDLKALPQPRVDEKDANFTAPRNHIERQMARIWADILKINEAGIGIDNDFFNLGGHSLKATLLVAKINKILDTGLQLTDVFQFPTIRELADNVLKSKNNDYHNMDKIEEREYYQLSYNQKRLWLLSRLKEESASYNMPGRIELNHPVNEDIVKKVLHMLTQRHESLRTGFKTIHHEPVQFIAKDVDLSFKVIDLSASELDPQQKQKKREQLNTAEASASFDLEQVPLFRALLIKLADSHYDFIFNMHHIISDGWSIELLKKEFWLCYEALRNGDQFALPPLTLQYKDFAAWHNKLLMAPGVKEKSVAFWKNIFLTNDEPLALASSLNGDSNDPAGAVYRLIIEEKTAAPLTRLVQENHTTLFTFLFSIYLLLLKRLSGQNHITSSIIAAARYHGPLQQIVGFFVNSILFKTQVDENEPFDEFLKRVNTEVVEFFQHQEIPLEVVLKELKIKHPEVPVSFNMLNIKDQHDHIGQEILSTGNGHMENGHDVKFDIEVYAGEYQNGILLIWAYRKSMFEPMDIQYAANEYHKLLTYFMDNGQKTYNQYKGSKKKRKSLF